MHYLKYFCDFFSTKKTPQNLSSNQFYSVKSLIKKKSDSLSPSLSSLLSILVKFT